MGDASYTPPPSMMVGFVGDTRRGEPEPDDRVGHLVRHTTQRRARTKGDVLVSICGRKIGRNLGGGFRVCAGWQSWARVRLCTHCKKISDSWAARRAPRRAAA